VVGRHFLHPEAKSLSPTGEPCESYTTGLLRWRPIRATFPFTYIGKEIERRAQEGEDIALAAEVHPRTYAPRQTASTRPASADLIRRAKPFSIRGLMRASELSQHAVEPFFEKCSRSPVHPQSAGRSCGKTGA
jgi:hypothetical protein